MFSASPMSRVTLVVRTEDTRSVLNELGRLGIMQLTIAELPATLSPGAFQRSEVCGEMLARLNVLRNQLGIHKAVLTEASTGPPDLAATQAAMCILESRVSPIMDERETVRGQLATQVERQKALAPLPRADVPTELLQASRYLAVRMGSAPTEALAALNSGTDNDFLCITGAVFGARTGVLVMTGKQNESALLDLLARCEFAAIELPPHDPGITLRDLIESVDRSIQSLNTRVHELDNRLAALAVENARLLDHWESILQTGLAIEKALGSARTTTRTAWLTGWIPTRCEEDLREAVAAVCGDVAWIGMCPAAPRRDLDAPVLLSSPAWLRPFDALVTACGHPRPGDIVPSLFFAISFLAMFGFMFGDVGHGLFLLIGGITLRLTARRTGWRQSGLLMSYAGAVSMLFGFIYGSCFGLPAFHPYAWWHDPLSVDPVALLRIAMAFGAGLLVAGLILNILNRWRSLDLLHALLDRSGLAGLIVYVGALLLAQDCVDGRARTVLQVLMGAGLLAWMLHVPLADRAAGHPASFGISLAVAIVELWEGLLMYLANTISFVRLAAYAMSHAALLAAFVALADILRPRSPVGALLALASGNLLALLLEGVIAAVQALRLEYYEFYGKFFRGDGRPFSPFRIGVCES